MSRRTQAQRSEASRNALLEAAARGFARYGYAQLSLAMVAQEAGYTRGALYHQFGGKEQLALAVVSWVRETWEAEVGPNLSADRDPADALLALARDHAIYCRRDIAAVLLHLRTELGAHDHPIQAALADIVDRLLTECGRLITAGRRAGSIPPGPPVRDTAHALISVLESVPIALAGRAPHDVALTERAVRGVLDLPRSASRKGASR